MLIKIYRGIKYLGISSLIAKLLSFFSFFIVGIYLNPEQVGLYATVIGSIGIIVSLQNGSIQPLMIQRRVIHKKIESYYIAYAFIVNVILVFISLFLIAFYSNFKSSQLIISMLMILLALTSTGILIKRVKYYEVADFKRASQLEILYTFIQYSGLILGAIVIKSELSYALSIIFLISLNVFYLSKEIKKINFKIKHSVLLVKKSIWLMLNSLTSSLIINLPYFILSKSRDASELGLFFFVNQLLFSFSAVIAKPINSTLLPILAASGQKYKVKREYSKVLVILGLIVLFLGLSFQFIIGNLVSMLWAGKWNDAIPIFEVSIIIFSIRVSSNFYWSFSQYNGDWSLRPKFLFFDIMLFSVGMLYTIDLGGDIYSIANTYYMALGFSTIVSQIYLTIKYKLNTFFLILVQCLVVGYAFF